MTKILLISEDEYLKNLIKKFSINSDFMLVCNKSTNDPLDILSSICTSNPSLLILDDDFIQPNSVHLLNSIKKVKSKLSIIFITSDTSLKLGREIHSIGVKFYVIRPLSESTFYEYLKSANKQLDKKKYY